jgi:hypothetical protein
LQTQAHKIIDAFCERIFLPKKQIVFEQGVKFGLIPAAYNQFYSVGGIETAVRSSNIG